MVLTPIITDTFAYVGGSLIGKHKVTKLSPNKSWEGYIVGSLMGTFMMSMYYTTFISSNVNIIMLILIILKVLHKLNLLKVKMMLIIVKI